MSSPTPSSGKKKRGRPKKQKSPDNNGRSGGKKIPVGSDLDQPSPLRSDDEMISSSLIQKLSQFKFDIKLAKNGSRDNSSVNLDRSLRDDDDFCESER